MESIIPYPLLQYLISWISPSGAVDLFFGWIALRVAYHVIAYLGRHAFGLSFRAANVISVRASRFLIGLIEDAAKRIAKAFARDPESQRLHDDWMREFKGKISWTEFQRMNEKFKTEREDHARQEQRRREEQQRRDHEDQKRREEDKPNPYVAALGVFGLSEPFTQRELRDRWVKLITPLHVDRLGFTSSKAAEVNCAKDTIYEARNWR